MHDNYLDLRVHRPQFGDWDLTALARGVKCPPVRPSCLLISSAESAKLGELVCLGVPVARDDPRRIDGITCNKMLALSGSHVIGYPD